jgi:hypothetical protein
MFPYLFSFESAVQNKMIQFSFNSNFLKSRDDCAKGPGADRFGGTGQILGSNIILKKDNS